MAGKKNNQDPVYKKWWFWVIIVVVVLGIIGFVNKKPESNPSTGQSTGQTTATDYTGKDAKMAYGELTSGGKEVKFVFDRNNNGGFSEESLQSFMQESFASESYDQMPFIVTKQTSDGNTVTLYVEYSSAIESSNAAESMKAALEEKLGVAEAMTACEMYGKRTHRDFDMHSVLGQIAQEAKDENTWYLKYTVDADGYEGLTMECYVTGTSAAPEVTDFTVY